MLKSVCRAEQFLKYAIRTGGCKQHERQHFIRAFHRRQNISRGKTMQRSQKLCGMVLAGGLLTKELVRNARCKEQFAHGKVAGEEEHRSPWLIDSPSNAATKKQHDDGRYLVVRIVAYLYSVTVWTIKITIRIVTLMVFFTPLAITFPIAYFWSDFREYWWRSTIWLVQRSGPTFIKLGQWASTRRDIFAKEFCDRMSILHTKTTFRQWKLSQHALDHMFGDSRWKNFIVSVKSDPIGSGCIAQVYNGVVDVYAFEEITGIQIPFAKNRYLDVAIKVAKEGVRESIDIDLSILQSIVRVMQVILPGLTYVDPVSCLNQFKEVLEQQVDLRNEARALKRFDENFDPIKTGVRFPKVLCYSSDVIIETHEQGLYVNRLVTDEDLSGQKAMKKKVALIGARALLKMVFVDNFVHGDLHPGNILVSFNDPDRQQSEWFSSFKGTIDRLKEAVKNLVSMSNDIRISSGEEPLSQAEEPTLVILDTGITIEETPQNLQKLRLLFRAVVDRKGRDVAKLLLIHSPTDHCTDPEAFCTEVDRIVQIARSKNSLSRLNITEMLNELFAIVRHYEVSLDPSFTTVVLAVMVLEGLGRSLDPDLDLFHCARPFLFSMMPS